MFVEPFVLVCIPDSFINPNIRRKMKRIPIPYHLSKFILLTVCLYALNASSARAQLRFSVSQPTAIYSANSGSTVLIGPNRDRGFSRPVNIGFPFTYGCKTYTQFIGTPSGWILLGNINTDGIAGEHNNDMLTAPFGPILAPFFDNLKTSRSGNVNYVLSGTAPNRVLTIEWLNMLWQFDATAPCISFQLKLYETTNVIDFTYKREAGAFSNGGFTFSPGAAIGLNSGTSDTDFYSLDNSGPAPTARYGTLIDTITTKPLTNQVYRWTPFPSITTQAGAPAISKCNNILNQVILGVQVTLPCGTEAVTQFQLNMTGSTAPLTDVTGIHIYYTGNSAAFSPIGEFKAGGTMPATGTITVTGSQPLVVGTNYFWVAYDISASAPVGNIVQAQCTQLIVGPNSVVPSPIVTGVRNIVFCTAPGGVNNERFWVKADAGTSTTADGGSLSTWNDQSGNNRHASSSAAANNPTYYNNGTNNINFNPVVHFNAAAQVAATASYMNITSNGILPSGNNPYVVYAVVTPGAGNLSTPGKFLVSGDAVNGINAFVSRAGNAFSDTWDADDLTVGSQWTTNYPSLAVFDYNSARRQLFVSGSPVGTKTGNSRSCINANDALGCQVNAGGTHADFYDGGIAEIITYPTTAHNQAARNQVESYLGIKYGITLLHDYVSSDGSTVWSRSLNTSYNNNIVGIARDDNGALSQKQSKSTAVTADILTMYVGTRQTDQAANTGTFTGGDKSFFMAGNNGLPYVFNSMVTDVPAGIGCRLQRVWLSQKTNFTNTDLTLQFDFNSISPGTPLLASDLRLLVDDNGVFSNAAIVATTTITVASAVVTVVVPASSITSAQPYFTLASTGVPIALPVRIDAFSASCLQKKVQVNWTMGATGNNSITIERSGGGGNFVPLRVVAGDQSVQRSYTWTDGAPLPGVCAYRLKIVDNKSNTVSYSSIASVSGCVRGNSVLIVSDPATGKSSMLAIQLPQRAVVDIGFYNVLGHQLTIPGLTGRHFMDRGSYNLSVPSQNLATGVYFLSVAINNEKRVYRVTL
jgi:hypothetical protein